MFVAMDSESDTVTEDFTSWVIQLLSEKSKADDGASEMAQQVRAPATKPDDLILISATNRVEGRLTQTSCPLTSPCALLTLMQTYV